MRVKVEAQCTKVGMRGASVSDMMNGGPKIVSSSPAKNVFPPEWIIEWEDGDIDVVQPTTLLWIEAN